MHIITRDYETYWAQDYTLSNMSTSAYVFDPRFEVIMISVKIDGGRTVYMEEPQWRAFAQSVDWSQVGLLGHHTHFDGLIDAHYYGIRPRFWFDTLSMSRAITGPKHKHSLEHLARRWECGEKGKEYLNTKGKRRADFTPDEFATYGQYCVNDTDLTHAIFRKMATHVDGPSNPPRPFPRAELELIDTTIRMFTEPKFHLDETLMRQYLADEIELKAGFIKRVAEDYGWIDAETEFKKHLSSSDKFAALLEHQGIEPAMKQGKNEAIYAFAKTDPEFQELLDHERDEVKWLAEARLSAKSTLNETRTERMLSLGAGDRAMPVYLNYYGAHPGRWSGGDKVNFQNFERTNKKDPRKGTIRKAIRAPKGYRIVVADSGQIEARGTAWFAGHQSLVDQFAKDEDVYSKFASEAFGRPVDRKHVAEDELPGMVGKICTLGLGYAMGVFKLAAEFLKGANGAPPIRFTAEDIEKLSIDTGSFFANPYNVEQIDKMRSRLELHDRMIHCAVTNHFVQVYRTVNKPIKDLWGMLDNLLQDMTEGKECAFGPNDCLTLEKEAIRLPSGLCLHYRGITRGEPEPGRKKGQIRYFNGRNMQLIHGGSLTENIIQALCRIIVAEQMRQLAKKYPVATMSHDEIVMVVPAVIAEECLAETLATMKAVGSWAKGLPVNAEGGIGETYGEAKH